MKMACIHLRYINKNGKLSDEGYALYLISKFVLLSLDQYLCWWTIIPREYHPPSSQCFGTAMVY